MNKEEIEEIENVLKRNKPFYEGGTYDYFKCSSIEKILQENKQLKERIDKAIEYIENELEFDMPSSEVCDMKIILDILKGVKDD